MLKNCCSQNKTKKSKTISHEQYPNLISSSVNWCVILAENESRCKTMRLEYFFLNLKKKTMTFCLCPLVLFSRCRIKRDTMIEELLVVTNSQQQLNPIYIRICFALDMLADTAVSLASDKPYGLSKERTQWVIKWILISCWLSNISNLI